MHIETHSKHDAITSARLAVSRRIQPAMNLGESRFLSARFGRMIEIVILDEDRERYGELDGQRKGYLL